ncbi:MAG: hypothetical protein ACREBU_13830, partial [Nitrososphaera sp.]
MKRSQISSCSQEQSSPEQNKNNVEQLLSKDSAGIYNHMDSNTRQLYLNAIHEIAKRSRYSECEIAQLAIKLAKEAAAVNRNDNRSAHIGFYLIDKGRPQ